MIGYCDQLQLLSCISEAHTLAALYNFTQKTGSWPRGLCHGVYSQGFKINMYYSYCSPYTLCAELYLAFLISYGWLRVLVHLHNVFWHGHSHTFHSGHLNKSNRRRDFCWTGTRCSTRTTGSRWGTWLSPERCRRLS